MKLLTYKFLVIFSIMGLFATKLNANDLSSIQEKIKQQQNKIHQQSKERNNLQYKLKTQEIQINDVMLQLHKTESSLSELRNIIKKTELEIDQLEKQEKKQKERLKAQLDSAFRSGINPSVIEKLLSKDAKKADRMAKYYEHMNQARMALINDIHNTQAKLVEQKLFLEQQIQTKIEQLSAHKKQKNELEKVTKQREKTLYSINSKLKKDQNRLLLLQQNEQALQAQITSATEQAEQRENKEIKKLQDIKTKSGKGKLTKSEIQKVRAGLGLGRPKRQYAMPVRGKIIQRFSPNKTWKGIIIKASEGKDVNVITSGRVILSGWLTGYGNTVIVDHGKGYLSIYGFNSTILVNKNDRVTAGDVIAKVGKSGGRVESALYFEIRRKGIAKNPLSWVR